MLIFEGLPPQVVSNTIENHNKLSNTLLNNVELENNHITEDNLSKDKLIAKTLCETDRYLNLSTICEIFNSELYQYGCKVNKRGEISSFDRSK